MSEQTRSPSGQIIKDPGPFLAKVVIGEPVDFVSNLVPRAIIKSAF